MEQKNVPLTREQIRALPVLKDENGRPKPSYIPPFPNNAQRRAEMRPIPHNNRKQGATRSTQREEVILRAPVMEDGKVKLDKDGNPEYTVERTGFFKTIYHQLVRAKENSAYTKLMKRHDDRKNGTAPDGAKDAGELSEHAKDNS